MPKNTWWKLCLLCSLTVLFACTEEEKNEEVWEICPFTNAALQQTTVKAGDLVTITGEGFAPDLNLYFRSTLYKIQAENPDVASDGKQITFTVPNIEGDTYKIIIEQEGEWTLGQLLTIEKSYIEVETKRKLLAISYDNGIAGSHNVHYDIRFTYQGDSLATVQQTDPGNRKQWLDYFKVDYQPDNSILFRADMSLVNPSSELTGWQDYFTMVPENSRVKQVVRNGSSLADWEYTSQGYLQLAHNTSNYANGYVYTSGNLTTWDYRNSMELPKFLVYDQIDNTNLMGMDFGALYCIFMISNSLNTPEFYAHILRLAGKASILMPSGIKGRSWNHTENVFDFNYRTDEQGFITEATSTQYSYYIDVDTGNLVEMDATKKFTFTWE